jgi:TolB protein
MPRMHSKLPLAAAALAAVVVSSVGAAGTAAPAPRDSILISSTRDAALHNELWSLDLRTGRRVNVSRSPAGDREPAVAPDGGTVAFVSDRGGIEALYLAKPDGSGLRRLAGPFPEQGGRFNVQLHEPAWSPDGRRLLFVVSWFTRGGAPQGERTDEVRIVARTGGATKRIARSPGIEGARWSPDGRRLGISTIDSGGFRTTVYAAGGRRLWRLGGRLADWSARGDLALVLFVPSASVTVVAAEGKARWRVRGDNAVWSPDGRLLAVLERGALRVLDERRRVRLRSRGDLGQLFVSSWLPGGRALLVSTEDGRLLRLGLDGAQTVVSRGAGLPVLGPDGALAAVTRSSIVVRRHGRARAYSMSWKVGLCFGGLPDSILWAGPNRLLYTLGHGGQHEGDLWVVAGGTIRRLAGGSGGWRGAPVWSPDGSRIAYEHGSVLTHGGGCAGPYQPHLRLADAGGGSVRVLTRPGGNYDRNPRWSRDGRHVAYERGSVGDETAFGILAVDVATGREQRLTTGFDSTPSWTADGLSIVYQHAGQLRRVLLSDRTVTDLGRGEQPEAAPIGDLVAFLRGGALWTVRGDGTSERRLASARPATPSQFPLRAPTPRWSPDGRRLAFADARGILVVGRDGQDETLVPARGAGNVSWSADGARLSFTATVGDYTRGIFNSDYVARTELYTVPASGGRPTRVTNDLANVLGPAAWRP